MALNMDLIVFAQTGHVLAGAFRNQTAGAGPTVAELAGDGLWLRNATDAALQLIVAPEYLGIASTPLRDDVLLAARHFQVVDGLPEGKAAIAAPVTLTGTDVTVTLPAAATSDIETWVVVSGSSTTIVQKVEIAETDTSGTEPMALLSGDYQVLALIPGFRMWLGMVTVP